MQIKFVRRPYRGDSPLAPDRAPVPAARLATLPPTSTARTGRSSSTSVGGSLDDAPDLVVIRSHHERLPCMRHRGRIARGQLRRRGLHVPPDEAARTRTPSSSTRVTPAFLKDFRAARAVTITHRAARWSPPRRCGRSDQAAPLFRSQLHRRQPRMPAALHILLQGRLLRGRAIVLHAARRRRARRNRTPARPSPLLPGRPSPRRSAFRPPPVRWHARHESVVSVRRDRGLHSVGRLDRARRRGGSPKPVRRLRNVDARKLRRSHKRQNLDATTRP